MCAENLRAPVPASKNGWALCFLYHSAPGRMLLKPLIRPGLSRLAGRFLDSRASLPLAERFMRKNGIRREDFYCAGFRCFNDCFTRRIREGLRPIDDAPDALIAPCDGLLSAYRIRDGLVVPVKQSRYTISDLLGGDPAAKEFDGGHCLVFRLCVNHYHRYAYPDGGRMLKAAFLPGVLHTVRPIALATEPVFVRNCREYALLETDHLGLAAQIEVGAMLVGRISNHPAPARFERGQEKGMFLYGGSTVILLLGPGRVALGEGVEALAAEGLELPVALGERIGTIQK